MLKIVDRIDLALAKELGDRRREKHGVTHHEWEVLEMKMWKQFCEAKDNGGVTKTYNINQFVSLPWNWQALQQAKIVNALYYYAKESYVNGQPEPLQDNEFSLITLPNLNSIPRDELSPKNLISGNIPNQQQFLQDQQLLCHHHSSVKKVQFLHLIFSFFQRLTEFLLVYHL